MTALAVWLGWLWFAPAVEFHSQREAVWLAHPAAIRDLHYALGGELLVSVGDNGAVKFWNTSDGSERKTELAKAWHADLSAISNDGKLLAVVDREFVIHIADLGRWKETTTIDRFSADGVQSIAFSRDGRRLGGYSLADNTIRSWRTRDGKAAGPNIPAGFPGATHVAFRADGSTLLTASRDGYLVKEWSLKTGKRIGQYGVEDVLYKRPEKILVSPDDKRVLVSTWLGRVVEWNAKTHKMTRWMQAHKIGLDFACFAISRDGKTLVTAQSNGGFYLPSHLRVWRANDWKLIREFRTPRPLAVFTDEGWTFTALSISPDGRWIACGHACGHISIWKNPN